MKLIDADKLNVIGSELYNEEKLVIDPRELMDELGSGWHSLHPQEVTIKLMGKPTRFGVWMKDCNEGYVSRIVYESIPGLGEQKKWGVVLGCSPNSNTETVVITALE